MLNILNLYQVFTAILRDMTREWLDTVW